MPGNVFDGLDEIIERQKQAEEKAKQDHEEILDAINKANAGKRKHSETIEQSATLDGVRESINQRNQAFSIKNFIRSAMPEYMWIGDEADFNNEKKFSLILILSSIGAMLLCTVISIVSFGIYTTFTLFENIWLLHMLFVLKYIIKTKRAYCNFDYALNSFEDFEPDADGVLRKTKYKGHYKWFLILGCIAFALNAISAWVMDGSKLPVLVTILELATLGLNIFTAYKVTDFFASYGPIKFTGMNESRTAKVVLVFDAGMNKLYTEEDYYKQFPFMK